MEYRKEKRTKNLTLRDIHIGDWVQVWRDTIKQHYPPMKIISIDDDGTVGLIIDEEQRFDPMLENIKDIDALPITPDLLKGFGFEKDCDNVYWHGSFYSLVMAVDNQLDVMDFSCMTKYNEAVELGEIAYMHELQQALHEERNFIGTFEPEWKGVER